MVNGIHSLILIIATVKEVMLREVWKIFLEFLKELQKIVSPITLSQQSHYVKYGVFFMSSRGDLPEQQLFSIFVRTRLN